jgi:hypothetical protein
MTPKEKAQELTDNYKRLFWQISLEQLKICALITVDEIISANPHSNPLNTSVFSTMSYWQEVKQEIENL